uniref:FERM and PDZ domain containing 1 n=1 Tax=Oncorhynchus tshawytscha TaxID=74940 RepID=A0AAZ3SHV5_ONCTS
ESQRDREEREIERVRETARSLGVLEINIYLESFISNDLLYTLLIKMMRKRILCVCVWVAGPADGRLIPGDQVVKINNVAVDDLTPEQAADLIRECQHSVMITVLRNSGPKSSFITPEKRAKLRSNPVKVRFAEEVEVNSHSQGNSLLFLPNVLKVYLENGQTKAFKFEPNTTVKEKLSLSRIEHYSISKLLLLEQEVHKLLLLHEEERIQQVVHQKEVHDYRCLFRVCFIPREPEHLLQDDPTAFPVPLPGINDVLQERFAVEMRCNTALRLAALHIQERLASCGQSPRTKLKIITKSWGIENFISSTLLRNMREKDLRKAIGYHMKKSQSQEPKQKVLSANQAKINYLEELCDLKSFGGKSFSATMMLQDRESMVTLLVGSRYGISQVVNHKLSIMTTLTEFSSITRIELLPESDRVPITLLLESVAAKELSCLVAGYCRALVDPSLIIFPWTQDGKQHRVSNLNYAELSLMLEYLPSPPEASDDEDEEEKREERRRSNEGTGQEVLSVSGCLRSSSSSLMDCVFTFEQSDARHYYNICPNVTPDSTHSLTHPHPETEEEEGGGEEEEQGALLTLEPVPILQPPPGFGDSSSDEEFFDARDRIASPENPTSGTVSRGVSGLLLSCKGETSEGGGGRDMFSRLSRKRSKKRRSFMQTDFTSTVSYPGPDQNQDSDESQQLSLDPEPSEQSQNPCPTISSLSHAEGEASQLESKPILAKPSPEGSSRNRRQSMETEPDMMESKSVTALVTAASLSITAVRCRVEPDGKESPDQRGDGEEVEGEMEEEEGGGEAGAGPFTCHIEERQPLLISEGPPSVRGSQFSRRPLCLTKDEDQEASFVPQISISHPGVYGRDTGGEQGVAGGEESVTPLSAPPPPTSPLPPFPAPSIPHTERAERDSKDGNVGSQPKLFTLSDGEKDINCLTQVHRKLAISHQDLTSQRKFSCRTSSPPASQPSSSALALPLTTSPPLSSFLSSSPPSSLLSPSFPRSVLPPSSSMELSPLLSPLLSPSNCFLSQSSLHDDISRLRHRRFPPPPAGFQTVRSDVDELLTLLQGGRMGSRGGRHPRETCATHFSENKRLLHGEARRLMAGCQKVVRVGQTPDEMLFSLSDSFRTLVGMAGMCLWFSGCDRCDRRNAEALAGLADVARTYREFVLAAERASGRRSCHDLSTKLLAKQCTALTASVFCLTQLFRTLTAL